MRHESSTSADAQGKATTEPRQTTVPTGTRVLESVKIGGRRYTSREAADRMCVHADATADKRALRVKTTQRREVEITEAERFLDTIGIGGGSGRTKRTKHARKGSSQ